MFQGPLARFGDTAANVGMLALLDNLEQTKAWAPEIKTVFASMAAASWRVVLMPIDACKTILQVEGKDGLKKLGAKVRVGPTVRGTVLVVPSVQPLWVTILGSRLTAR